MTCDPRPILRAAALAVLASLTLASGAATARASKANLQCGDVVEGEFPKAQTTHTYFIDLAPLEILNFSVTPVGDILKLRYAWVFAPDGSRIYESKIQLHELRASVGRMSAPGTYRIVVKSLDAGVYVLQVGCILADGTEVEPVVLPGESAHFEGFKGFPGLRQLDLSGFSFTKLALDLPVEGEISGEDGEVFGFHFDGEEGQDVGLSFERTGGNLNLALILLDATDRVGFQSSLVSSESLNTDLILPTSGEYTLAVAPARLLPPEQPEPTSFRVRISRVEPSS